MPTGVELAPSQLKAFDIAEINWKEGCTVKELITILSSFDDDMIVVCGNSDGACTQIMSNHVSVQDLSGWPAEDAGVPNHTEVVALASGNSIPGLQL
jgi:hypothetical protein